MKVIYFSFFPFFYLFGSVLGTNRAHAVWTYTLFFPTPSPIPPASPELRGSLCQVWASIGPWRLGFVGVTWRWLAARSHGRHGGWSIAGRYWFLEKCRNYSNISLIWVFLAALGTQPMDSWAKPPQTQGTDTLERPGRSLWWEHSGKPGNLPFYSLLVGPWGKWLFHLPVNACYLIITIRPEPWELCLVSPNPSQPLSPQEEGSVCSEGYSPSQIALLHGRAAT